MRGLTPLVALVIVVSAVGSTVAGCSDTSRLELSRATVPVPANPSEAAAYLTISNVGDMDDRLLAVRSSVASFTHLHRTDIADNGFATMDSVTTLDIPAGKTVELRPGGLHLMMMNPKPMSEGDRVTLTLTFEHAGKLTVVAKVTA